MQELMTVKGVAAEFGISENTVRRWVKRRVISYTKLPSGGIRFTDDDLMEFLKRGKHKAAGTP